MTDKAQRAIGGLPEPSSTTTKPTSKKAATTSAQEPSSQETPGPGPSKDAPFAPLLWEIANIPSYHKQAFCARINYQLKNTHGPSFYKKYGFAEWTAYRDQALEDGLIEIGEGDVKTKDWIAMTAKGQRLHQSYETGDLPTGGASSRPVLPSAPSGSKTKSSTTHLFESDSIPAPMVDDAIFKPLLTILNDRLPAELRPLRALIGGELTTGHASFYKERGMSGWKAYAEAAEKAGWVTLGKGSMFGQDWVELAQKGKDEMLWGV